MHTVTLSNLTTYQVNLLLDLVDSDVVSRPKLRSPMHEEREALRVELERLAA